MEVCVRCNSKIKDGDNYTDIVVWDMLDGEGCEAGESTICNPCHK